MTQYKVDNNIGLKLISETGTTYNGQVNSNANTSFKDDNWIRIPKGKPSLELYFGLYVSRGDSIDIEQDYEKFEKEHKTDLSSKTLDEYLNKQRSMYIHMMPEDSSGVFIYGIKDDNNKFFLKRCNEIHKKSRTDA